MFLVRVAAAFAVTMMASACAGPPPETNPPVAPLEGPLGPSTSPPPEAAPRLSAEVTKGVTALEANDVAGAKSHFQAAVQADPKDADATYYLGVLSEKSGDVAGAEASYKKALGLRPGFEGAEVNLSGLFDDALGVTSSALTEHPKNGSLHLNTGIAFAGKKDAPSAVREFGAALKIAPNDATFRLVYGHWLAALGQTDGAVTQLQAALPLAATNVGIVAAIGHELHLAKAFPQCVAVMDKAVALKDAAELRTERAACKIGLQDDAGAVSDLKAAASSDPSYAPAQYYLGNELAKGGDFAAAITAYQMFLKLEPNGPLAKAVTEKIRLAKAPHH
jgi:Tfp pilus assembly protein PilF